MESNTLSPASEGAYSDSVIENEIASYRAISALAVTSLLLGGASILSFVSEFFYLSAIAAVISGLLAIRRIHRLPDVLTGQGMARVGIGMGLVFGLAAVTNDTVQGMVRSNKAATFGKMYADLLKRGSLNQCFWYQSQPASRKDVDPDKLASDATKNSGPDGRSRFAEMSGPIAAIQAKIGSGPDGHVEFDRVESTGLDGVTPYAAIRFKVHGSGAPPADPDGHVHGAAATTEDEYALILAKADVHGGRYDWWIETVNFPYTPNSHVLKAKPIDDGHGHGGGDDDHAEHQGHGGH